jgi:hypothetical protein
VLTPEDYRQLAERCARLAFECATPGVAEELRTLALDYLTRAVSPIAKRSSHVRQAISRVSALRIGRALPPGPSAGSSSAHS